MKRSAKSTKETTANTTKVQNIKKEPEEITPVRRTTRENAGKNLYTRKFKFSEDYDSDDDSKFAKSLNTSSELSPKPTSSQKSTKNEKKLNFTLGSSRVYSRIKTIEVEPPKSAKSEVETCVIEPDITVPVVDPPRRRYKKRRKTEETQEDLNSYEDSIPTHVAKLKKRNRSRLARTETDTSLHGFLELNIDESSNSKIENNSTLPVFDPNNAPWTPIDITPNFAIELTSTGRGRKKNSKIQIPKVVPKYYQMPHDPWGFGVRCLKCNSVMAKHNWPKHNMSLHNNLAWREGDPPVDITCQETVMPLLNLVIKAKCTLRCPKCNDQKLSAWGFISHVLSCGKSTEEIEKEKVTCTLCNSRMLPLSLKAHIIQSHTPKNNTPTTVPVTPESETPKTEKRKAASRALIKFKECEEDISSSYIKVPRPPAAPVFFMNIWRSHLTNTSNGIAKCFSVNCKFQAKTLYTIIQHYSTCEEAPAEVFTCTLCNFVTNVEDKVKAHARKIHGPKELDPKKKIKVEPDDSEFKSETEEEDNDFWDAMNIDVCDQNTLKKETKRVRSYVAGRGTLKQCFRYKFLYETREPSFPNFTYTAAYKWALEFRQKYFKDSLFMNVCSNFSSVPNEDTYLSKIKKSIHISTVKIVEVMLDIRKYPHNWEQLDLFGSRVEGKVVTMFCGGPVVSLAWVPMPTSYNIDQYLAVACKYEMDSYYKTGASYKHPGLIQIWNCGILNNGTHPQTQPKVSYLIAHDYGIIWDMQWCPSGCYQENTRLGLLAIATSNSHIYILSLPFPSQLPKTESSPPLYFCTPVYALQLYEKGDKLLGNVECQVTKLTWSKILGHNIISAGYSNGIVALWNLSTKSTLLRKVENGVVVLMPYLTIQAHRGPVTVVDFQTESTRWLFTASVDERSKFWDLNDPKYAAYEHRRGMVNDGFWFPHWNSAVICVDDGLLHLNTVSSLLTPRDFGSKPVPIFRTNSTCKTISANEWTNSIAQGSVSGDLQIMFLDQIFYGLEYEKTMRHKRFLCGFTRWIDRTKTPEELIRLDENRKMLVEKDHHEFSKLCENEVEILPFRYNDAARSYGVVFCDMTLDNRQKFPKEAFAYVPDPANGFPNDMYPLVSVNKVQANPNQHSFQHLAVGYQAGFVRLQSVLFMKVRTINE